jgi:hypothetical protein
MASPSRLTTCCPLQAKHCQDCDYQAYLVRCIPDESGSIVVTMWSVHLSFLLRSLRRSWSGCIDCLSVPCLLSISFVDSGEATLRTSRCRRRAQGLLFMPRRSCPLLIWGVVRNAPKPARTKISSKWHTTAHRSFECSTSVL